eukprot:CAMPEP_0116049848 /NCGR_PEP_ID=MMETSP0322-20121206/40_1 /TAXON_ID=163516 /ORGANISM="Leptocylindrus danicus var. apora, Strain B651" /LENGTH=83 /DNA_ID=CAMNT_0003532307 /DNA_START=1286 /DNA_END=1534 /DNA_ORIENTATION=-
MAFHTAVKADGGKFPEMYVGYPGLRSKFFTKCFYTFFSKKELNAYLESDLFKMHNTFKQFSKIDYTVYEVLSGTERTMDLGSW